MQVAEPCFGDVASQSREQSGTVPHFSIPSAAATHKPRRGNRCPAEPSVAAASTTQDAHRQASLSSLSSSASSPAPERLLLPVQKNGDGLLNFASARSGVGIGPSHVPSTCHGLANIPNAAGDIQGNGLGVLVKGTLPPWTQAA